MLSVGCHVGNRVDNNNCRGSTSELSSFTAHPMEVIKQIITDALPKSCDLDPAPNWLVVESVDELLPMLSRIITQHAYIQPKFQTNSRLVTSRH